MYKRQATQAADEYSAGVDDSEEDETVKELIKRKVDTIDVDGNEEAADMPHEEYPHQNESWFKRLRNAERSKPDHTYKACRSQGSGCGRIQC